MGFAILPQGIPYGTDGKTGAQNDKLGFEIASLAMTIIYNHYEK